MGDQWAPPFLKNSRSKALEVGSLGKTLAYTEDGTTSETRSVIPYTFLNSVSILEIPFSVRMEIIYYLNSKFFNESEIGHKLMETERKQITQGHGSCLSSN